MTSHSETGKPTAAGEMVLLDYELWAEGGGRTDLVDTTREEVAQKADVKLPVKATLAGTKTVDPSGVDQTAPATFTFTAGQPDSTGDITYRVVSKRGIAEKTSNFKVQSGLKLNISGTLVEGTSWGPTTSRSAGRGSRSRPTRTTA